MKPNELTPEALLQFFAELEGSDNDEEECEIHYGCSCVIQKGRKAAQMLVDVQKILGAQPGAAAPARDDEAEMTAQIMEVERALMEPSQPPEPDPNAEALSEAEGEIDRLLVQNLELKEQNTKLRDKMRDLYKQIERLHTRQEMSKLLGTLDQKIEEEAQKKESGETGEAEEETAATEESETGNEAEAQEETEEAVPSGEGADESEGSGEPEAAAVEDEEVEPELAVMDGAEEDEPEAESQAADESETAAEADREKN